MDLIGIILLWMGIFAGKFPAIRTIGINQYNNIFFNFKICDFCQISATFFALRFNTCNGCHVVLKIGVENGWSKKNFQVVSILQFGIGVGVSSVASVTLIIEDGESGTVATYLSIKF